LAYVTTGPRASSRDECSHEKTPSISPSEPPVDCRTYRGEDKLRKMSNTHPYSGNSPIPKVADFLREQRERFPDPQAQPAPEQPQYEERQHDAGAGGRAGARAELGDESSGGKTKKADAHPTARDQTKAVKKGQSSGDGNRRTVKDPTTGNEIVIEDVTVDFRKAAENPRVVVPRTAIPGQPGVVAVSVFSLLGILCWNVGADLLAGK
jgi:hypothetical protein